jgi:hypothetical protein
MHREQLRIPGTETYDEAGTYLFIPDPYRYRLILDVDTAGNPVGWSHEMYKNGERLSSESGMSEPFTSALHEHASFLAWLERMRRTLGDLKP